MSHDEEPRAIELPDPETAQDPFRWLEDLDSPETQRWVARQNEAAASYLQAGGARDRIRDRVRELIDYERCGLPVKRGGRYFFTRNPGLDNQPSYYWMQRVDDEPSLLIAAEEFETDDPLSLIGHMPSEDGKLVAYGLSRSGSDWREWRVREVETGRDLGDRIRWAKGRWPRWTQDSRGFFYGRFDEPAAGEIYKAENTRHRVCYHRIGTDQSEDDLVYERPDHPEWQFDFHVTEDGRYLILTVHVGTQSENGVLCKDLTAPEASFGELLSSFDAAYAPVGNDGSTFYFRTDHSASRGRVIAIDLDRPDPEHWEEIVPEAPGALEVVTLVGDHLVLIYLEHAHHRVRVVHRSGHLVRDVELPDIGTVRGFDGYRTDPETFFWFSGFIHPGQIYRYQVDSGAIDLFRGNGTSFDARDVETRQVFFETADGTKVPMFLVHRRDLVKDGENPVYLYGYGGFGISLTPAYSTIIAGWLEMGGVYAVANLRGGGEYGQAWRDAGAREQKQNTFDDFIGAAEWLIDNGYTRPARLGVGGRSNGGLLIGAVLTQRPDLFGACHTAYGVLDMLRFHQFTLGRHWVSDYGNPDDVDDRQYLLAYSPYHNLRSGTEYPPTLITTGDHDDRVFPGHSLKFAAALQAAQSGSAPILLRVYPKMGHGDGAPTDRVIDELTDQIVFLGQTLEVSAPESPTPEGP